MARVRPFARGTASLFSVQSTPLSVGLLLIGATTVEYSLDFAEMLPVIAAVAIGHWSFYALNDIIDLEVDAKQGRSSKALVGNRRWVPLVSVVVAVMYVISISIAFAYMPLGAFSFYILASLTGLLYNLNSKTYDLSGVFLGIWAVCMVLSGALYADPQVALQTLAIAGVGFFHMIWMTAEGSLKDIDTGEESIPKRFDCKVKDDQYPMLWTSIRFNLFATAMIAAQSIIIVLIPVLDGAQKSDVIPIYLAFIGVGLMAVTWDSIIEHQKYDKDKIKKKIALHEVAVVLTIWGVSMSFAFRGDLVVIMGGAIVWGLGVQTVLYGHPLRFP